MGTKWEEEIDCRLLLYKTGFDKRKKLLIDFADDMDDYECEFEITANEIKFYPRKIQLLY